MFKELLQYIIENKKWWLMPPVFIFITVGFLVFLSTVSPVSPFIYMLF